jgi:hypothetical protein
MIGKVVFLILALLASVASGQSVNLTDFSGGLNVFTNPTLIKANEASRFQNWRFDDVGSLVPRPGYHQIRGDMTGYKACLWMLGVKPTRWQSVLLQEYQVDSANDRSRILASRGRAGAMSKDSVAKLVENWYPGQTIATQDDRYVYLANGHNTAKVLNCQWDTMTATPITPPAPGQLEVSETRKTCNLIGNYQYCIVGQIPCSSFTTAVPWSQMHGPLSIPVTTSSHAVDLSCFYPYGQDSACSAPAGTDTRWYMILRTHNGRADRPCFDSLFILDSVLLRQDTCYRYHYTDTFTDASLGSSRFWNRINDSAAAGLPSWYQWVDQYPTDSLVSRLKTSYVPGILNHWKRFTDIADTAFKDTIIGEGWLGGYSTWEMHWGNAYWITLLDKRTGAESDTSSISFLPGRAGKKVHYASMYLPPVPSNLYARIVKRGFWAPHVDSIGSAFFEQDQTCPMASHFRIIYETDTIWDSSQTVWYDTLSPAKQLLVNDAWDRRVLRERFDGLVYHDTRYYGWVNNTVYISEPDSPGTFGFNSVISLADEAGDRVIGAASMDEGLALYKQNSMWLLYTHDGDLLNRQKVSPGFGLASPFALAKYNGGSLVLGRRGGFFEFPSDNRSLNPNRRLLTNTVWPLLQRDDSVLARAVSGVYRDVWLVNYPGNDTTFAFDLQRQAWSVWTFDFTASTLFDTTVASSGATLGNFWFVPQGSTRLYELATRDTTDAGTAFSCIYQKDYLVYSGDELSLPMEASFSSGGTAATDSAMIRIYEPSGTIVDSTKMSMKTRFSIRALAYRGTSFPNWYNLSVQAAPHPDLKLFGVEVRFAPAGKNERR